MKTEHRDIIDRARLSGLPPSCLAHELLVHDLVESGLFELKNLHSPYGKLNQGQQQEVIDRLTEAAEKAVHNAISIISSRNVSTIEVTMKEVKFNSKQLTLTSIVDAKDPNRHDLIDSAGRICLLVMAPDDYNDGLDFIQPDRDQHDLPLHVSDLTGNLFAGGAGPDEPDGDDVFVGHDQDPLYAEAVQHVIETQRASISAVQRHLKVGYNRAARMIEWMEAQGIVTQMNSNGSREVLTQALQTAPNDDDIVDAGQPGDFEEVQDVGQNPAVFEKEFGEFTYDDAAQLIVLKASASFGIDWMQSRLAISSEQAETLLLRLIDNNVVELLTEGETWVDNTYTVIATLDDLGPNLSVE